MVHPLMTGFFRLEGATDGGPWFGYVFPSLPDIGPFFSVDSLREIDALYGLPDMRIDGDKVYTRADAEWVAAMEFHDTKHYYVPCALRWEFVSR